MRGVFLPGNSRVDIHEVADPEPGPGQVLLAMRACRLSGSADLNQHFAGNL